MNKIIALAFHQAAGIIAKMQNIFRQINWRCLI